MVTLPGRSTKRMLSFTTKALTSCLKSLLAPISLICWLCATVHAECISKENHESLSTFLVLDVSNWVCLRNFPNGFQKLEWMRLKV